MPTTQLSDRAVILAEGPEAEHFLQNILTTDLDRLADGEVKPGALLTPQGKILFDFLISRDGENRLRLDCRADAVDDFVRRLTLYKLRAKVDISKQEQELVFSRWEIDSTASHSDSDEPCWLADRRFPTEAKVERHYGQAIATDAGPGDWTRLRITHGIAESGFDYPAGDAFPHDVLLDETDGVGFRKGCYVGQEVVSRMQHRGTARRRVMLVQGEADLSASSGEVSANGRAIGALGSTVDRQGLAIMRIDRVADALDAGHPITAGGVAVSLSVPPWACYTLPRQDPSAEEA